MRNRFGLIIGVVIAIILVGARARRNQNAPLDELEIDVSQDDIETLEEQIKQLEFEDLQGISETNSSIILSLDEFNILTDSIEDLEFEDLEGIPEN